MSPDPGVCEAGEARQHYGRLVEQADLYGKACREAWVVEPAVVALLWSQLLTR